MARRHGQRGFEAAMRYPLIDAIFNRRSRRVVRGVKTVRAGSLSYTSSHEPQPLDPLEEAVLIAVIGRTGRFTPPDRPFQDHQGTNILGSPNGSFTGRAAGSADNFQMTHFFMMNDSGVYHLDHRRGGNVRLESTPESLLANAEKVKVKIADRRIDFPRRMPYYLDSNRLLSNLPGSTIFIPVVESTAMYINIFMYMFQAPDGQRPVFVDELNGFRPFASQRWIDSGYLNDKMRIPLSASVRFRTDVEVHLLFQNLMLTAQALGIGGWIHAAFPTRIMLGHPAFTTPENRGLGFRWVIPDRSPLANPDMGALAHPVGLDGHIECFCPPYYDSMSDAVDAFLKTKFDPQVGIYRDKAAMEQIFRESLADKYLAECPPYTEESVACAKDMCENMYKVHGRFPSPLVGMDAIHAPGIWFQAHHLEIEYYDQLFRDGYSDTQRDHHALWHEDEED